MSTLPRSEEREPQPRATASRGRPAADAATSVLVTGVFAPWVQRQALSKDNWKPTSSQLLADPTIEQGVGRYLVTELLTSAGVPGELRRVLPVRRAPPAGPGVGGLLLLADSRPVAKLAVFGFLAAPELQPPCSRTANRGY